MLQLNCSAGTIFHLTQSKKHQKKFTMADKEIILPRSQVLSWTALYTRNHPCKWRAFYSSRTL